MSFKTYTSFKKFFKYLKIALQGKEQEFTSGSKQLWNNLEGKPTWTQPKYMKERCNRVVEFTDKRLKGGLDDFCKLHNIVIFVHGVDDSDSDSDVDSISD